MFLNKFARKLARLITITGCSSALFLSHGMNEESYAEKIVTSDPIKTPELQDQGIYYKVNDMKGILAIFKKEFELLPENSRFFGFLNIGNTVINQDYLSDPVKQSPLLNKEDPKDFKELMRTFQIFGITCYSAQRATDLTDPKDAILHALTEAEITFFPEKEMNNEYTRLEIDTQNYIPRNIKTKLIKKPVYQGKGGKSAKGIYYSGYSGGKVRSVPPFTNEKAIDSEIYKNDEICYDKDDNTYVPCGIFYKDGVIFCDGYETSEGLEVFLKSENGKDCNYVFFVDNEPSKITNASKVCAKLKIDFMGIHHR